MTPCLHSEDINVGGDHTSYTHMAMSGTRYTCLKTEFLCSLTVVSKKNKSITQINQAMHKSINDSSIILLTSEREIVKLFEIE